MKIQIKYFDETIDKLVVNPKGDMIDLRCSKVYINGDLKTEQIFYRAGDLVFVELGVGMILPDGYKALVYPRSSLFKNHKLLLTNSVGVIDNSYCGDNDQWCAMFVAMGAGSLEHNERLLQFDIVKNNVNQDLTLETVTELTNKTRGGYGSTGKL